MMVLYSGTTCPFSHRCRFVLFEKGMDFEIRDVDLFAKPEDIADVVAGFCSNDYLTGEILIADGGLNLT